MTIITNPITTSSLLASSSAWESFISASTTAELCHAWLQITCAQIMQVEHAAVLIADPNSHSFIPLAVWPNEESDFSNLADIVTKSLQEKKSAILSCESKSRITNKIAYPIKSKNEIHSIVALEMNTGSTIDAMQILHWNSCWISNIIEQRNSIHNEINYIRARKIIDYLIASQQDQGLQKSLLTLCQEIKNTFPCSKVAIGTYKNSKIHLQTISNTITPEKNSHLTHCYSNAMENALDYDALSWSYVNQDNSISNKLNLALLEASGCTSLLIVPLMLNGNKIGAFTLERENMLQFTEDEISFADALRTILAPVLATKISANKNSIQRLAQETRSALEKLTGPDHLVIKTITSIAAATIILCLLIHIPFKVSAKTVIEGEIQRTATAPFNGYIKTNNLKAGDHVKKNQVILELDTRELEIEKARWEGERDQYSSKLQQAIAEKDLSAVQIINAQLKQAESQLALSNEKISKSKIKAPFNGIIISGDQSQQIGAPVEPGKKLFEIAPLDSYRVILQVDEKDIRHIKEKQPGQLIISGLTGEPLTIQVKKITPVATAKDGKNYFRVEAQLFDQTVHLRPGMEGIGKIKTARQSLFWIATHSFRDWLGMTLWAWLP